MHLARYLCPLLYSLCPFVLSQALPWAFSYYGHSVALGLGSRRRSRICACMTYLVRLGSCLSPFTISLMVAHHRERSTSLSSASVLSHPLDSGVHCGVAVSGMLRRADYLTAGDLGSAIVQPHHAYRTRKPTWLQTFALSCFPDMLVAPLGFPARSVRCSEGRLLPTFSPYRGNHTRTETAHSSIVQVPRLHNTGASSP